MTQASSVKNPDLNTTTFLDQLIVAMIHFDGFIRKSNMNPGLKFELALRLEVQETNYTIGPEGLVLYLWVFGCLPRF